MIVSPDVAERLADLLLADRHCLVASLGLPFTQGAAVAIERDQLFPAVLVTDAAAAAVRERQLRAGLNGSARIAVLRSHRPTELVADVAVLTKHLLPCWSEHLRAMAPRAVVFACRPPRPRSRAWEAGHDLAHASFAAHRDRAMVLCSSMWPRDRQDDSRFIGLPEPRLLAIP